MSERFRIERLSSDLDRSRFVSGSTPLDRYFREQASQDIKRRIATCFVAISVERGDVAGFYTLTATSIALDALPSEVVKKLPRYPVVPAALLGRLAVAGTYQGQGLGSVLLADALLRVARADVGILAMLVDAKDEAAQSFYEHFGFKRLAGEARRLSLPIGIALRKLSS